LHNDQGQFLNLNRLLKRIIDPLPIWGTALVLALVVASWAEGVLGVGISGWSALLERAHLFAAAFIAIFIEGMPFLLLGALAAGLVKEFFTEEDLAHWAPKNALPGALVGALLGFIIPVGKAGVPLLARQLARQGVPVSLAAAILFAAPALNPVALAVTVAVFGFGPLFWGRIGLTYLIAVGMGLLFSRAEPGDVFREEKQEPWIAPGILDSSRAQRALRTLRVQRVLVSAGDEFFDLGRFLVLGALLAALLQALIPTAGLLKMGNQPLLSAVGMALLAVMGSAGAAEDAFVVQAFLGILPGGSILVFLALGPMMDVPQILALLRVIRTRMVVYAALLALLGSLAVGYALNLGGLR
jgi:uncharacterized protein